MSVAESQLEGSTSTASYAVVMAGIALQLIVQVLLQLLLAGLFGTTPPMDAYLFAMGLPMSLSAILAGTLGPPLITLLAGDEAGVDQRSYFAGTVVLGTAILASVLAAAGMVLSVPLMRWLQPGLGSAELAETARLFRILAWLIPANTLIGLLQSVLNASLNFKVPAMAGVAGPAVTVLIVWRWGAGDIDAVAWATLAGAGVNVSIQSLAVIPRIAIPRPQEYLPRLHSLFILAGPILAGMLVLKVDPLVDRFVTSNLNDGRMAQLQFAYRILTIFVMLASGTLSTVSFPRIARKSGAGPDQLAEETGNGLAVLITLCVPALAAMTFFARPLVQDLFERGQFTHRDTLMVAQLLQVYAPVLLGAALGELCGKTLYACRDTLTPNVVGPAFLVIGFVLKLLLVPQGGALILAGITSAVWVLAGLALTAVMLRRIGNGALKRAAPSILPTTIATGVAMAAGAGVLQLPVYFPGLSGLLAGATAYFVTMAVLGKEFRRTVYGLFQR